MMQVYESRERRETNSWRHLSHACRTQKNPAEHNIDRFQDITSSFRGSRPMTKRAHTETIFFSFFLNRDINIMRSLRSTLSHSTSVAVVFLSADVKYLR